MPTYDYRCEACGHAFEHFQSMSSRRLRTCPACKEKKLVRLVGAGAGVIFKGSGFYETDYKRARSKGAGDGATDGAKAKTDDAKRGDAKGGSGGDGGGGGDAKGSGSTGGGSSNGSSGNGRRGNGKGGNGSDGG